MSLLGSSVLRGLRGLRGGAAGLRRLSSDAPRDELRVRYLDGADSGERAPPLARDVITTPSL